MPSIVPAFGTSIVQSDLAFMLQDQLNGMGDFLTQDIGSLAWCEAFTFARSLVATRQFVSLLANQLSPNSASIYINRYANIYNLLGISNPVTVASEVEMLQAQYGTPPIYSNLVTYLQDTLGSVFIDLEVAPELQYLATTDPEVQLIQDGYEYSAPLCDIKVYVWQPRDNKDNLLMPTSIFNNVVDSYKMYMKNWCPSYIAFTTMNLINRGFQDGYANNYNGMNYNNYLDGYNVVSGSAGSTTITGVGTAFLEYPNGSKGDFIGAVLDNYYPPIQIVDDTNKLQTYYVSAVGSNTQLTITTPLINNITSRTYRCLGFILDTPGVLDDGALIGFSTSED